MEVLGAVSENGFSLDELVFRTKELFEREGLSGFFSLILQLADERICMNMVNGKRNHNGRSCCSHPQYEHHDQLDRQFRTSVGTVMIRWRRLRRTHCGKSVIPLREFLGLERYQSKTSELEKLVTEVVSEQSYRRSSNHLQSIGSIPVPRSNAHRWVVQSKCDQIDVGTETFELLLADGTGYKCRSNPESGMNNRGELRLALGVDKSGSVVPLGAFSGKRWQEISSIIKGQRSSGELVAEMLVSDGERGLVQSLAGLCGDHQRSHWHLIRDLNHTMWQARADKTQRRGIQKELSAIIGIEIPRDDFEQVRDEDKKALEQAVAVAEMDVAS
jgi:hypothetical protein